MKLSAKAKRAIEQAKSIAPEFHSVPYDDKTYEALRVRADWCINRNDGALWFTSPEGWNIKMIEPVCTRVARVEGPSITAFRELCIHCKDNAIKAGARVGLLREFFVTHEDRFAATLRAFSAKEINV